MECWLSLLMVIHYLLIKETANRDYHFVVLWLLKLLMNKPTRPPFKKPLANPGARHPGLFLSWPLCDARRQAERVGIRSRGSRGAAGEE